MPEVEIPVDSFVRVFGIEALTGVKIKIKGSYYDVSMHGKTLTIQRCINLRMGVIYKEFIFTLAFDSRPYIKILFASEFVIIGS